MKLTELLICIVIFTISIISLFNALTSVNRNTEKIRLCENKINVVIDTDIKLRREIRKVQTCYWKNFSNEIKDDLNRLAQINIDDVKILSVEEIESNNKKLQGIQINWEYKEKQFVTKEYIKVRLDNEK